MGVLLPDLRGNGDTEENQTENKTFTDLSCNIIKKQEQRQEKQPFYSPPVMSYDMAPPPPLCPPPTSDSWTPPNSLHTCLSPSTDTPLPPNPLLISEENKSSPDGVPLCAGCSMRIEDKYYQKISSPRESKFHQYHLKCLKCAECRVELGGDNNPTCYEKNGSIFCKDDYVKKSESLRPPCPRCSLPIQHGDLVMEVRDHAFFHVDCFRCVQCDIKLKKGDFFGTYDNMLYCQLHYEQLAIMSPRFTPPPPQQHPINPDHMQDPNMFYPPPGAPPFAPFGAPPPPQPPPHPTGDSSWYGSNDFPMNSGPEFTYENNNEPMLKKRRGRKKRKMETFTPIGGFMEGGAFPGGVMEGGPQTKTKRARTSFKHHQLRIMKNHFNMNQNPDSRELKLLSQRTQLDKKVLQVWFQNARAKWRRTKAQDGSPGSTGMSSSSGTQQSNPGQPHHQPHGGSGTECDASSPASDCSGPMISCY